MLRNVVVTGVVASLMGGFVLIAQSLNGITQPEMEGGQPRMAQNDADRDQPAQPMEDRQEAQPMPQRQPQQPRQQPQQMPQRGVPQPPSPMMGQMHPPGRPMMGPMMCPMMRMMMGGMKGSMNRGRMLGPGGGMRQPLPQNRTEETGSLRQGRVRFANR